MWRLARRETGEEAPAVWHAGSPDKDTRRLHTGRAPGPLPPGAKREKGQEWQPKRQISFQDAAVITAAVVVVEVEVV